MSGHLNDDEEDFEYDYNGDRERDWEQSKEEEEAEKIRDIQEKWTKNGSAIPSNVVPIRQGG